jgi:hypothetical protein
VRLLDVAQTLLCQRRDSALGAFAAAPPPDALELRWLFLDRHLCLAIP